LGRAPVGTQVNLEVDVIAKYVERLLSPNIPSASGFTDTPENNT
jgi:riboflavin synthase alpha subunit